MLMLCYNIDIPKKNTMSEDITHQLEPRFLDYPNPSQVFGMLNGALAKFEDRYTSEGEPFVWRDTDENGSKVVTLEATAGHDHLSMLVIKDTNGNVTNETTVRSGYIEKTLITRYSKLFDNTSLEYAQTPPRHIGKSEERTVLEEFMREVRGIAKEAHKQAHNQPGVGATVLSLHGLQVVKR